MELDRQYLFQAPTRVSFGFGTAATLGRELAALGARHPLIVTDGGVIGAGLLDGPRASLAEAGLDATVFDNVEANPSVETVEAAIAAYQSNGCDALVAIGGGSPMDVAKAAGIVIANGGGIRDYEGKPELIAADLPPFVCIPTTCGTGAEVTPFAVITDHARSWKMSIASPRAIPAVAIVDPELFLGLPPALVAATGMDALTHAIESYTNRAAQPFADALDLQAIRLIGRSLRPAVANANRAAIADMAIAATLAGMGFAQNRLGIVHAISHPVTSYVGTPHGVANAILLPYVLEYNAIGCGDRLIDVAVALDGPTAGQVTPETAIAAVRRLATDVGIPATLGAVGVTEEHVERIATDAMKSGNVQINPRRATRDSILGVIRHALTGSREGDQAR
ncbi:MAG TPA: iron-containing alcohol dehydrogenase [Thermomicrobiales bacterium]|jgi:alcohol dehydrogenase class IV